MHDTIYLMFNFTLRNFQCINLILDPHYNRWLSLSMSEFDSLLVKFSGWGYSGFCLYCKTNIRKFRAHFYYSCWGVIKRSYTQATIFLKFSRIIYKLYNETIIVVFGWFGTSKAFSLSLSKNCNNFLHL